MKNETYIIRDRYKKTNFKKPDEYNDLIDKELNIFRKKTSELLGEDYYFSYKFLYFGDLYKEYGSSVKILNHIEIYVGIERFKEIMNYFSKSNNYSYDFIKYIQNNDLIIPSITDDTVVVKENKISIKYWIFLSLIDIVFIVYWLYSIFINNFNHWICYVSLTGFTISFIMCIIKLRNLNLFLSKIKPD